MVTQPKVRQFGIPTYLLPAPANRMRFNATQDWRHCGCTSSSPLGVTIARRENELFSQSSSISQGLFLLLFGKLGRGHFPGAFGDEFEQLLVRLLFDVGTDDI